MTAVSFLIVFQQSIPSIHERVELLTLPALSFHLPLLARYGKRRRHGARAVPLVGILLVAAWATVLAAALCLVVLPFLLGRMLFVLLHLPKRWTHDTASFSVGLVALKVCWGWARNV